MISLTPINTEEGTITSAIIRDLTEQMKTQHLLQESEKLASTGRMTARVVHEINSPLVGIKNSLHLIKGAIPENYRHYKYTNLIEKEINRISEIIRQMYTLYQPQKCVANQFNINDTLSDVINLFDSVKRTQEVKIKTDLKYENNILNLSENLVRQILYNLLLNAVDVSPSNETVVVRADDEDARLILEISNHGDDIAEELQDKIFEPFFSTKAADRDNSNLGTGLSICKSAVEAIGAVCNWSKALMWSLYLKPGFQRN